MNNLTAIYSQCPVALQNLICSFHGHQTNRHRYNSRFYKLLKEYQANDSEEKRRGYQAMRLRWLLHEARNSPFWAQRFLRYSVNVDAGDLHAELTKLPILSKETVKAHVSDIANTDVDSGIQSEKTSGSTGSGLKFITTTEAIQRQWAVWWRYRMEHGITFDNWQGWFGGKPVVPITQKRSPFWRTNVPGKQVLFSQYHLRPDTADLYIKEIRKRQICWLHGYPSQISLLAGYMIDLKLDRPECVKIITIGSETLTPAQRTVIQKAFGVRVRQHYGLAEGVANISENSNGRLSVDTDFSHVEFIPVSEHTPECCRIIGTNLNNNAFPLIRYDTGDIATITYSPHGHIIHAIDGRIEDFLTLKNGTKVGRLSMLYDFVSIHEMQIRQHQPGMASFLIVKGANYNESTEETRLQRYVSERFGNLLDYDIKYVDSIPKTTSGKLRLVVSTPSHSEC